MSALIRDGKFAVIHTNNFGAGWSTWGRNYGDFKELVIDRQLAELILAENFDEARDYAAHKWPDCCTLGMTCCVVTWLPLGTLFRIHEYDGFESVVIYDPNEYYTVTEDES